MMEQTTYVYIIGREEGPVKIGITAALTSRFNSVQTGCPFPIKLLYAYPATDREHAQEHESIFHRAHAGKRLAGEWFDLDGERARDDLFTQFDYESWEQHTAFSRRRA